MAHPDRRKVRERSKIKKARESMLDRKSHFDILDLTPHNAIGFMRNAKHEIRLK